MVRHKYYKIIIFQDKIIFYELLEDKKQFNFVDIKQIFIEKSYMRTKVESSRQYMQLHTKNELYKFDIEGFENAGFKTDLLNICRKYNIKFETEEQREKSKNMLGFTELNRAVNENEIEKVKKFILVGADVNLKDKCGMTALHFAAQVQSVEIASMLINSGAKIDEVDNNGNTPLSTAILNYISDLSLIELLLKNGANPLIKNNYGETPISLAALIGNRELSVFFEEIPLRILSYNNI